MVEETKETGFCTHKAFCRDFEDTEFEDASHGWSRCAVSLIPKGEAKRQSPNCESMWVSILVNKSILCNYLYVITMTTP